MSLWQWGLTAGTKGILADAEKDGKVQGLVDIANIFVKGNWPDDPEGVKEMLVTYVVFPFVKRFLTPEQLGRAKQQGGM